MAGEYILITPGEVHEEIVGIAGSSGSTVDLTDALLFNHTTGDPYVMTTTAPTSTPTP